MAVQGVNQRLSFWETKSRGKGDSPAGNFGDELTTASGRTGKGDGGEDIPGKESIPGNNRLSTDEIMRMIQNRKSEIMEKVKKGETEPVIQIGAQAYTEKQWKKMLENLDDSEKDIKDMIREAIEEYKKTKAQMSQDEQKEV